MITRNQNDWTNKFPFLVNALKKLKLKSAILDGELVALNADKRSDFQTLQNFLHENDKSNQQHSMLVYYIFDLIYLNGYSLSEVPLIKRKEYLKELIQKYSTQPSMLRYSDHIIGQANSFFKKACALSLEGMVSKNIHSPYEQKRSHAWLKIKFLKGQEFLVIGFTNPQKRRYFKSLLLGVYSKTHTLQYCGKVGTGFTESSLKKISKLLNPYKTEQCPLPSKPKNLDPVTWLKPKVIVAVKFTEWTQDGALRHPSFKGVRYDKKPDEVIHERPKKNT